MPRDGRDLRRKGQFPVLLGCGVLPLLTMLLMVFVPEKPWLAAVFAGAFALLGEVCLLVPGKARLLAGLVSCAGMIGLGVVLLPMGFALLVPVCCCGLLLACLPMGGWPRERELQPFWYVAGVVLHLMAQVMVNVARAGGKNAGYLQAAPMLLVSFILFAALSMLSINRSSMDTASMGRQRIPASMRRMNRLLTAGLLGATLLISALPAVIRAVERAWDVLMQLLVRLMAWLMSLLPATETQGRGAIDPGDMSSLGDAAAEPSLLAVILEKIFFALAAMAGMVLTFFALRFLYKQLRKLARHVLALMRRYAAASSEDYDDEITDTREEGQRERSKPLQALRRRFALGDDRSLPPAERIRRRYAWVRLRHADWEDSRTARESLPEDAAQLYERARYSEHPVTEQDADTFTKGTRSV
ncbi:MAG: hypothetical protein ACI4MJ_08655 [Aristaeellaceae bacterium]